MLYICVSCGVIAVDPDDAIDRRFKVTHRRGGTAILICGDCYDKEQMKLVEQAYQLATSGHTIIIDDDGMPN